MRNWLDDALCASRDNVRDYSDIWFHDDEDSEDKIAFDHSIAQRICADCPVRDMCLKSALETQTVYGFRGGITQEQTRQVLSVDETGKEVRRPEYPFCPFCGAPTASLRPTTIDLPGGGRWSVAKAVKCSVCDFEWKSRASHNAILAFAKEQNKKAEAEARDAQALRGLVKPT